MTICRSYDRWGTGTTERAAAQPSPNLRQRPPHLSSIGKPTEQQNESETPAMRILRVFRSQLQSGVYTHKQRLKLLPSSPPQPPAPSARSRTMENSKTRAKWLKNMFYALFTSQPAYGM